MTQQINDPFASPDKTPSVSFKNMPIGTTCSGAVTRAPELVQSRDYDTDMPAFWPDGNPKMSVVFHIALDGTGEERAVWASKPSSLFAACAAAQKDAGAQIAVGGHVTITLTGEEPNDNPKKNARKLYAVRYVPANPFAEAQQAPTAVAPPVQQTYAQQPAPAPYVPPVQQAYPQQVAPAPQAYAAPVAAPVQASAPAAGPTAEQVAALRAAGVDPATVFPGFTGA